MHDGTTPLVLAARLAVEGMLEDLINSHADVNAVDDLGKRGCPARRAPGRLPPVSPNLASASPTRQVCPALGCCCEQRGGRPRAPEERRQQGHAGQQGGLGARLSPSATPA